MNFPPPDPRRFLLESIPDRFSQLSAEDFGNFIRYLFQLDGYEVEPTVTSVDLGHHVRAKKDDSSLIIIPIHTAAQELIEIDSIRKAIRARELYKSEQSWVITNSTFSKEARSFADHSDIELWDWNSLYEGICQLFFEGKSHLEYTPPPPVYTEQDADDISELKLKVKWMPQEGVGKEWFNLELKVSNPTTRNVYVHLELPVLIDTRQNQIAADEWGSEEFVSGLIYSGATIKTNAMFKANKIGERPLGGRVMLTYHERDTAPKTYHLSSRLKGEACYFVTYCYGRGSEEYLAMIDYRDQVLSRTFIGRAMIVLYYALSPIMVRLAKRHKCVDLAVRWFTKKIVEVRFDNFFKGRGSTS